MEANISSFIFHEKDLNHLIVEPAVSCSPRHIEDIKQRVISGPNLSCKLTICLLSKRKNLVLVGDLLRFGSFKWK